MRSYIVFVGLLVLVASQDFSQDVAVASQMLAELVESSEERLRELESSWAVAEARKRETVETLARTKQEQINECGRREAAIHDKEEEIWRTTDFIQWIKHRIDSNGGRLEILEYARCASTSNYVSTLKENKIQLTVSAFLRQQIQRIVDENSSFAQKRQALQEIGEFIERIKDSEYDILAMQREAELALDEKLTNLLETNSQDRMSPFDFQRFTQEKNDVVLTLNEIEDHVNKIIPNGQQNMIRSGFGYAAFKEQILRENELFGRHQVEQANKLENQQDQLVTLDNSHRQCVARLGDFDVSIKLAVEDLEQSTRAYDRSRAQIEDEIVTFQKIREAYEGKVVNLEDDTEDGGDDGLSSADVWAGEAEPAGSGQDFEEEGDVSDELNEEFDVQEFPDDEAEGFEEQVLDHDSEATGTPDVEATGAPDAETVEEDSEEDEEVEEEEEDDEEEDGEGAPGTTDEPPNLEENEVTEPEETVYDESQEIERLALEAPVADDNAIDFDDFVPEDEDGDIPEGLIEVAHSSNDDDDEIIL